MKNNKLIIIIVLLLLIVIILIAHFMTSKKNNSYSNDELNIQFELIGDDIFLYEGEEFIDPGFVATIDGLDIKKFVTKVGDVDTTTAGEYLLSYNLNYEGEEIPLSRKVIVSPLESSTINLSLIGDHILYLEKNSEYEELGATATINGKDISNEIKIVNLINLNEVGEYFVTYSIEYNDLNESIDRIVNVFDIDNMFNIDSDNNIIEINLDDSFSYVRYPNGSVNSSNHISYSYQDVGDYEFTLYRKDLKQYKKIINISKEQFKLSDISGTCEAILKDGKTTVTVKTDNKIKKYNYNGTITDSNIYKADKYLRDAYVILDDGSSEKKINCDIKMEYLPVNKPKNSIKYSAESDSLKIYMVKKDGLYLSYIWAKDPVYQMRKQYSGNSSKYPIDIMKSAIKSDNLGNKMVLGFNASSPANEVYNKDWNKIGTYHLKEPLPLMLQNGKVLANEPNRSSSRWIYYIDGSNQLKYTPKISSLTKDERKKLYDSILDAGTQNTMTFLTPFVGNGKVLDLSSMSTASKLKEKARRQVLCQIDSNNFILLTSINGDSKGNVTRPYIAQYAVNLGCKTAVNLDGGGSTCLFFKKAGATLKNSVTGGGRKLTSQVYFTELD